MSATEEGSSSKGALRRLSTEDIEALYRNHRVTHDQKRWMLTEKARIKLDDMISEKGTPVAMLQRMVDNASEGWNKLQEAARDREEKGTTFANRLDVVLGTLQIFGAATEGIGEVLGMNTENALLSMGAPPGLARTMNTVAWLAPQIIPVGAAARVATGVGRSVGKEVATGVMSKETLNELRAMRAIADGLSVEGIPGAEAVVERALRAVGKTEAADALKASMEAAGKESAASKIASEVASKKSVAMKAASFTPMPFQEEAARWAGSVTKEEARAELPKLMRKFGVSRADLRTMAKETPGKNLTAEQFYGTLKAMESRGVELSRFARAAVKEDATNADRLAFARYATALFTGARDKPHISKEFKEMLRHWDPANVADGKLEDALTTFAKDMALLSRNEAGKLIRKQEGYTLGIGLGALGQFSWQGLREYYSNLLLPLSWASATLGNTISVGTAITERATGGSIPEAYWMVKGMTLAIGDAVNAGLGQHGLILPMAEKFGLASRGSAQAARVASSDRNVIAGLHGRIVNMQRDTLVANDTMFKLILQRGFLYAEGARLANLMGAKNTGAFVNNFVRFAPGRYMDEAAEFAARGTFNNDLGRLGTLLKSAAESGPGYLWFTFITSPINLAKFAWHRTPGLQMVGKQLYADIAAGGRRADEAMARLTLGWMQGMYWWEMAKEGRVTGHGPVDPDLRRAWLATHQPYSRRVGVEEKGWLAMNRMDPAIHTIGFIADMNEVWEQLDEITAAQAGQAILYSVLHNFVDRTPGRGVFEIAESLTGMKRADRPTQQDLKILENPLVTAITGGPLVARTAKTGIPGLIPGDPVSRDQRTWGDMVRARIPGYSQTVPPVVDGYNDPVIPPESIGTAWFGYFDPLVPKVGVEEDDPVKKEGWKVRATLPYYGDVIGRGEIHDEWNIKTAQPNDPLPVKLTPQQRHRWQQIGKNIIRGDGSEENPGIMKGLVETEEYQQLPPATKQKEFNAWMSKAKSEAAKSLLLEDETLAEQWANNKVKSLLPHTTTEDERVELRGAPQEMMEEYRDSAPQDREELLKWGVLDPDKEFKKPSVEILGIGVGGGQYRPPVFPKTKPKETAPAIPAMPPAGPATPRSQ